MVKKISFIKLIRLWGIIFISSLVGIIISIDIIITYNDFNIRMDTLRTNYIKQQKKDVKREVNRVVEMISCERMQDKNDEHTKRRWLERINYIRFGKNDNGYLFAGSWDGISLAHGDIPELIGKDILDFTDSKGNKTSQLLIATSKIEGGGFVPFWWIKPDTGIESSKITYVEGIPDWEMLIAAGIYDDDIEHDITILHNTLNEQMISKIGVLIIFIIITFCVFIFLFNFLSGKLKKDFNLFISFFKNAALSDKKIDNKFINYIELEQVSEYINQMIQDKSDVQQTISDERLKTERRLEQSRKMESIGTLTSGIAHDFNNILFIIKGNIELLMMTDKNEKFDIIIKASNRAIKLIEQITSFSRHDDVELKDVNIKPIIVESINLSKSSISENTSIISDIKDGNYIVKTDEIKIGQVVLNLITNACHAVEDIEGKILISLKNINIHNGDLIKKNLPKGDYAQLKITDNGCGIDPENLDKIFDPYFTTKDISKGTGLGLSIVYGIIKESKGFINVQSELNIGTTFDIFIPLV